jgi:hypothetical protein
MFTGGFFLGLSRKPGRNGKRNLVAEPHLADWKVLANLAGPTRNREMVQAGADLCIALHRSIETSRGTRDCGSDESALELSYSCDLGVVCLLSSAASSPRS